jgi:ubiquitin fusion degradation protein 1
MMQNLLLREGDVVTLRSAALPKGTFVKLQPHSKDFLDITNPRAVLETTLRNFSCLTVGDTVPIRYNNKAYFIDIIEAKPADAISVIETDCNVDFAPPLDYVEPDWKAEAAAAALAAAAAAAAAAPEAMATDGASGSGAAAEPEAPAVPTFLAFAGAGRRLDGKAAGESRPVAIPIPGARPAPASEPAASGSAPKAGSAPGGRKAGKLMFKDRLAAKFADKTGPGGGPAAPPPPPKEGPPKEEGPAFKAFSGAPNRLK